MTESGYVSGGFDASADQLRSRLASTTSRPTSSRSPSTSSRRTASRSTPSTRFNEPNTSYWGTQLGADGQPTGGRQEGAHIGPAAPAGGDPGARARRSTSPRRTPRSPRWTRPTRARSPRTGTRYPADVARPSSTSSTSTPTAPASAPPSRDIAKAERQAAVDERGRGQLGQRPETSRRWSPASAWPSGSSTTCASSSRRPGCSGSPSRTTTTWSPAARARQGPTGAASRCRSTAPPRTPSRPARSTRTRSSTPSATSLTTSARRPPRQGGRHEHDRRDPA